MSGQGFRVLDEAPYSSLHRFIVIVASTGTFTDLYAILALSATTFSILPFLFKGSTTLFALAGSIIFLGALVGTFTFGWLTDLFGRRLILIFDLAIVAILALISAFVATAYEFILIRFLIGVITGGDYAVTLPILAEMLPKRQRGRGMSYAWFGFVMGGFVVLLFGYALYRIIGPTPYEWRIVFGSVAIPAIIGILLRAKVPESPRWLAKRGRIDEAIEVIKKLTGQTVTAEEIRHAADHLVGRGRTLASQILEVLTKPAFVILIVPLMIADFAFDLIPGALATLNPFIFTLLGIKAATALLMSALFIGVQGISTLIVALTVEKIGRVKLMLVGGLIESLAALAVAFVYHNALLAFACALIISIFAFIVLPVTRNYGGELFPTVVRGGSSGLVTTADRVASAVGIYITPILLTLGGVPMLFIVFGIIGIIGFIFALVGVAPKGKIEGMSVDEVETKLFGT